jgi:hypothetical protein
MMKVCPDGAPVPDETQLVSIGKKKTFVEPVVSAPENILDVTKRFAFQALSAETSGA